MSGSITHAPMHVILAVDGSEHALAGARLLRDLPLPPGSVIDVLAVLTPRQTPGAAELQDALERARSVLQGSPAEICPAVLHGHPADALARFADGCRPDLIVAGAVGLRATLGILLGGIAQQLVEYAHWPVLVVRAPYAGLQRVLLVVDGSAPAHAAADYLARLPLPAGTSVDVLHVLPPAITAAALMPVDPLAFRAMPLEPYETTAVLAAEQSEREEREGAALVAEVASRLQAAGLAVATETRRGDAATEILACARDHGAHLIVAGSRGLSTVQGWLLGSVSRKLVHYAACSVLLVKRDLARE